MFAFENLDGSGPKTGSGSHLQDDQSKKILRALHDTAKRIDTYAARCRKVFDILASPEILGLHYRLKSLMMKMFQSEPGPGLSSSGLKTLELVWRKSVYEPVVAAKRVYKGIPIANWPTEDKVYLQSHLMSGQGHFHNLLMWIKINFLPERSMSLPQFDFEQIAFHDDDSQKGSGKNVARLDKSLVNQLIHRCLMYLGDLTRYQLDFIVGKERISLSGISQRYYHQALAIQPSNGLPYNQLATLASDFNFGLNSVFYYLRSLTVDEKFEGVEANLKRFLDQKSSKFVRLFGDEKFDDENLIERAVLHLHCLTNEFIFEDSTKKLPEICQESLNCVIQCLPLNPSEDFIAPQTASPNFSEEVATKMVLVLLLLMEKMQEKSQEKKVSMIQAYLLGLFAHFVTKLLGDLQLTFYGAEAMVEIFHPKEAEIKSQSENSELPKNVNGMSNGTGSNPMSTDEGSEKRSKISNKKRPNLLDRLRRKKRRPRGKENSNRNGLSDSESDLDYSSSDDSERGVSARNGQLSGDDSTSIEDCLSDSSLSDDEHFHQNENGILDSDNDSDDVSSSDDDDDDIVVESWKEIITVTELIKKIREHPLVEAIRICCLWLMGSRDLVKAAGSNVDILWQRLAKLFDTINIENFEPSQEVSNLLPSCRTMLSNKPLSEDFQTRGMKMFEKRQTNLCWNDQEFLTTIEMGLLRFLQLTEFRDWLINIPEVNLRVNGAGNVERSPTIQNGSEKPETRPAEQKSSDQKITLMQNMAQLWLQQEVKQLEHMTGGLTNFSPFLVVDHLAVIQHLVLVKKIVDAKKFVVIIPATVVQVLDDLKRSENGARNAIRWLEKEFKFGNRWLRAQKPEETKPLDELDYPRRKDKSQNQLIKILECCFYFASSQEKRGKNQPIVLLTVPPGSKLETDPNGLLSQYKSMSEAHNINLEEITSFFDRFKQPLARKERRQFDGNHRTQKMTHSEDQRSTKRNSGRLTNNKDKRKILKEKG